MSDARQTFRNGTFAALLLVLGLAVVAGASWAAIDKTQPWHPLEDVRANSTAIPDNNNSLDMNRDGKVDFVNAVEYADYAYEGGTDCLNYRGQASPNDKVLWCNETYVHLMGCDVIASDAPNDFAYNASPACGGDGPCPEAVSNFGTRTRHNIRTVFLERILKEVGNSTDSVLVEGCYAYSENDDGATPDDYPYRLDITCCDARFVGDSSPSSCGNGVVNYGEECDGANLGGESCQSRGWDGGSLGCNPDCTFDLSGCTMDIPDLPSCFGGETLVLTRGGLLPIAELVVGMEVLGRDLAAGVDVWAVVEEARERHAGGSFLINGVLRVTPEHFFAVQNDGRLRWVRAKGLVPGMRLVSRDGVLAVDSVVFVDESLAVYNPALSAPHTYYVLLDGEPVLVHNRKMRDPW